MSRQRTRPSGHTLLALAVWMLQLTALLLPAHRKEWGEAMVNELAYMSSGREALRWAFGCVMAACRERLAHELGTAFMRKKLRRTVLAIGLVLAVMAAGTWFDLKQYQRDRILITLEQKLRNAG
jgi:hypothetical protein